MNSKIRKNIIDGWCHAKNIFPNARLFYTEDEVIAAETRFMCLLPLCYCLLMPCVLILWNNRLLWKAMERIPTFGRFAFGVACWDICMLYLYQIKYNRTNVVINLVLLLFVGLLTLFLHGVIRKYFCFCISGISI